MSGVSKGAQVPPELDRRALRRQRNSAKFSPEWTSRALKADEMGFPSSLGSKNLRGRPEASGCQAPGEPISLVRFTSLPSEPEPRSRMDLGNPSRSALGSGNLNSKWNSTSGLTTSLSLDSPSTIPAPTSTRSGRHSTWLATRVNSRRVTRYNTACSRSLTMMHCLQEYGHQSTNCLLLLRQAAIKRRRKMEQEQGRLVPPLLPKTWKSRTRFSAYSTRGCSSFGRQRALASGGTVRPSILRQTSSEYSSYPVQFSTMGLLKCLMGVMLV